MGINALFFERLNPPPPCFPRYPGGGILGSDYTPPPRYKRVPGTLSRTPVYCKKNTCCTVLKLRKTKTKKILIKEIFSCHKKIFLNFRVTGKKRLIQKRLFNVNTQSSFRVTSTQLMAPRSRRELGDHSEGCTEYSISLLQRFS